MSTPTPALADAGHLLHDDLYVHLDEADYLAEQDDEWSAADIQTARGLIGDLVLVIRGLLICLLYTSPSPRDRTRSRMPSSA